MRYDPDLTKVDATRSPTKEEIEEQDQLQAEDQAVLEEDYLRETEDLARERKLSEAQRAAIRRRRMGRLGWPEDLFPS